MISIGNNNASKICWGNLEVKKILKDSSVVYELALPPDWIKVSYSGVSNQNLNYVYGRYIWTDGTNYYVSNGTRQYVLDPATRTWSSKTWNGVTNFLGEDIWMAGNEVWMFSGTGQYLLDKQTSTWVSTPWTGFNVPNEHFPKGTMVWTDGTNYYYSHYLSGTNFQYTLDVANRTATAKTWSGSIKSPTGTYIWRDSTGVYYSAGKNAQYKLQGTTSWVPSGFIASNTGVAPNIYGAYMWSDGIDVFCSYSSSTQYRKRPNSLYWDPVTWNFDVAPSDSIRDGRDVVNIAGETIWYQRYLNVYKFVNNFS